MSDCTAGVSVVIPTHNRPDSLRRLLDSIAASDPVPGGIEVVVIDDGSADDGPAQVALLSPVPCRYFRQDQSGPATARNHGWHEAVSDRIVFVDDDCVVEPPAFHCLWKALETSDAVGATIRPLGHTRLIAAYMDAERLVNHKVVDGEVRWLVTACAAFRRNALAQIGGFDEHFPRSAGEDADLTFRLAESGCRISVDPEAVIYHEHRAGLLQLIRTYYRHGTAQRLLASKHASRRTDLRTSTKERVSPAAWLETYRRYRLNETWGRSLVFVVLRAGMMAPWLVGALKGAAEDRPK